MKCHVIAPFHTIPSEEFSHCAFTQKALKLVKMLKIAGYEVVEYANEGSESVADEKVVILNSTEYTDFYPRQEATAFVGNYCNYGERGAPLFRDRVLEQLIKHADLGDIVCHPFGHASNNVVGLKFVHHVETGIGYPDTPFGCWRIFESEAWRHYHWGRDDGKPEFANDHGMCRNYSWVIPNSFDLDQWTISTETAGYFLYMGRICETKGMSTLVEIIKHAPQHNYVFAGQGDFKGLIADKLPSGVKVIFVGPLTGRARDDLVGKARALLMPTEFIEPFGGAGVEGQLTGTPLIAVDYGAFTETVIHGVNGFKCKTLGDWLAALEAADALDRRTIANIARSQYSLETCAHQYAAAFRQILDLGPLSADGGLRGMGWYTTQSYRVDATFNFSEMETEERPQAVQLAKYFQNVVAPNETLLDVGCATGFYVDEFRRVGLNAIGVDCSKELQESDTLFRLDVTDPNVEVPKADVVLSLEVAEHIEERRVDQYFNFIEQTGCHTVYFSAAAPGQGGVGHVNCQPKSYWTERFAKRDFVYDRNMTEKWLLFILMGYHLGWLTNNGMVFRRT